MMAGPVGDRDWSGGAHRIQLGPRRVPFLGHLLGPVTHPDDPFALRRLRGVRLQAGQKFGNVRDAGKIGIEHGVGGVDQVAVGVDEPRHQGGPCEVDLAGIPSGSAQGT
jgi:hypothetical protein